MEPVKTGTLEVPGAKRGAGFLAVAALNEAALNWEIT